MGVDVSKAKKQKEEEAARVAARNAQTATRSVKRWKVKLGENKIRILPPWCTDESKPTANQFCKETFQHWKLLGENSPPVVCVEKTPGAPEGAKCGVCGIVDQLRATKDPNDSLMAKELSAKVSYEANIVDLLDPVYTKQDIAEWSGNEYNAGRECPFNEGETKVQVYNFGKTLHTQFLDYICDSVDFTDLETGFDIIINREGKTRETTKYRMRLNTKATPFKAQGDVVVTEKLVDLDLLNPFKSPEDMQALINKSEFSYTAPKELQAAAGDSEQKLLGDGEETEEEVEEAPPVKTAKAKAKSGVAGKSVEDLAARLKAELAR